MTPAEEGAAILAEIKAMSEENRGDYAGMLHDRRPPWELPYLVALMSLVRSEDFQSAGGRWVMTVRDGDRPTSLSDHEIAEAWTWEPEYRLARHDSIGRVLVWREWLYDRGRGDGYASGVRETHREVHEVLVSESTTAGINAKCKWCDEAAR